MRNKIGKTNLRQSKVDRDWFRKKLADNKKSMRKLANHLGIDVAAVSRTFSGERKMQLEEVNGIAYFLNAPIDEVLQHAGISKKGAGVARILLAAVVNHDGQIERLKEPKSLPQAFIARAQAAIQLQGNEKIVAAQIRAQEGALAMFDDAIVLFRATDGVDASAIGVLAICRSYDGEQIMAKIDRARKTGEARVICLNGKVREFALHTATPVLAIIP